MQKGFTFQQLAVILLVVLGLIAVIVLFATQIQGAGSSVSSISKGVEQGVGNVSGLLTSCTGQGGACKAACAAGETDIGQWNCAVASPHCCV
ncbi:hypothetical protein COT72_03315 [archaeon CG10_big_fil_rev_8_21_14_0_10_43_11]|nr:MAG: hypothetical protein COT72_03315 [archaeon CG10_big_fil_rev_8_21_14_0_10_43_11]